MSFKKGNFPDGFDLDMRPLHDFMRKMDSVFNESFKHIQTQFNLSSFKVDVEETDKHIIVKAALPGYRKEQISLEIVGSSLRIMAKESSSLDAMDEKNHAYSKQESLQYKERVITIPFEIPEKETKASFQNGLLEVIIPKKNEFRKFIDINDGL
ncbi:Hsp20/alpha crystallin family protein [Oceanobacillus senegalensis]|uniref:Hsp20/alpha crystallin family protein n=1 Tax=Oceanobacillus senegalensis TaxID=1936063 RepID=UPI000A309CA5|nr:Hsp20/alpha crystallin family protein [Oceanobacillus senegalensis]